MQVLADEDICSDPQFAILKVEQKFQVLCPAQVISASKTAV